jgi:hypothetical protein
VYSPSHSFTIGELPILKSQQNNLRRKLMKTILWLHIINLHHPGIGVLRGWLSYFNSEVTISSPGMHDFKSPAFTDVDVF